MIEPFLENLRKAGWRQQEIADMIGKSQAFINNLATGKCNCSLETARDLADAFGTTLDEVIGRTPPTDHVPPEPRTKTRIPRGVNVLRK